MPTANTIKINQSIARVPIELRGNIKGKTNRRRRDRNHRRGNHRKDDDIGPIVQLGHRIARNLIQIGIEAQACINGNRGGDEPPTQYGQNITNQ